MTASLVASAILHVVVLGLLLAAWRTITITPRGAADERISQTETISLEQRHAAPTVRAKRRPVTHPRAARPSSATPHHELAKQVSFAPPQPPARPHAATVSSISRDQAHFAQEVAQLNKGNDPHAIPTIDPGSAQPLSKSYAFNAHSTAGEAHGNGIISPVRSWQDRGLDCYYARYSYTYPDGATEDGNIVWPVCFDPGSDPFHQPPHSMPFPLPLAGYTLPPHTDLPPIEKDVYDQWAARNVRS